MDDAMRQGSKDKSVVYTGSAGQTQGDFVVIWLVAVCVILLSSGISMLPPESVKRIVQENGVVEVLTAFGYLAAALFLVFVGFRHRLSTAFSSGLVVTALGMRELDFHDRFTTMGIFKTKFYVSPEVPSGEKIIVTVIVLTLLFAVIKYCRNNFGAFRRALKGRQSWAIAAGLAIVFMVSSKLLDSASAPLQWVLSFVHSEPEMCTWVLEEIIEMAIPALILIATFKYHKATR